MQGTALGLNAGLGNLGVSVMQFLIPVVIASGFFGVFGGLPLVGGRRQSSWYARFSSKCRLGLPFLTCPQSPRFRYEQFKIARRSSYSG
jgi:nitrate/nitrite transporter NarK